MEPFFQGSVITTPQSFLFLLPKAPTDFKGEELWPASHSTVSSDVCAEIYPHIYSIRDTDSSKITQTVWRGRNFWAFFFVLIFSSFNLKSFTKKCRVYLMAEFGVHLCCP